MKQHISRRGFLVLGAAAGGVLAGKTLLAGADVQVDGSLGTVFFRGERVVVSVPEAAREAGGRWRAYDDAQALVTEGAHAAGNASVDMGALGVGWYRIAFEGVAGFTTAAVLERLRAVPPRESPVALDVALSWVPPEDAESWERCVRLAQAAGVVMVRDRLRRRDIQPEPGPLVSGAKYENAAAMQQEHGLHVLQVYHDTPRWAWEHEADRGRVPADLRDTFRFCRDAAAKFGKTVDAWQAWNEGNAPNFGAHCIDELCSHQKAAFLGFRAGHTDATVTWNPLGGVDSAGLCRGIAENATAPYFDVFALHTYDWPHAYMELRREALRAAAGKPLWVTESDRGLAADPESPHGDFTPEHERLKAELITQSYVSSLAAGAARHYHFILPQYMEQANTIQFGLLRHDQTPRMGYVALAALGRFLAGARYLGRWREDAREDVFIHAFRAQPDGKPRDVLVAWTEARVDWPERGRATADFSLQAAITVEGAWDYLGREMGSVAPDTLRTAPCFLVLPAGEVDKLGVLERLNVPAEDAGAASPVVLQLRAPDLPRSYRLHEWAHEHDRAFAPGEHEVSIVAYNFGAAPVTGSIEAASLPPGWRCAPESWALTIAPMERMAQPVLVHVPEPGPDSDTGAWLGFYGDFGTAGTPQLAFRAMPAGIDA